MKSQKFIQELKCNFTISLLIMLMLSFTTNLFADDHSNARGKGMSNASLVTSFGINAFSINPANYYINKYDNADKKQKKPTKKQETKPQFEISIFSIGGALGSNASFSFYEKYRDLISLNKENLIKTFTDVNKLEDLSQNILPDTKTNVDFDFEVKWISVNVSFPHIGALNFTISDKLALSTFVPGSGETLPGTYNVIYDPATGLSSLTNVELHQQEANSWWIRKYSLGASKVFEFKKGLIKNIAIGFAGSLVHGFGNIDAHKSDFYISTYGINYNTSAGVHIDSVKGVQNFNTQAALTDYFNDFAGNSSTNFSLFPKPAGTGYSIDFGFNMQIGNNFKIAASVADLGKIKWDYNTFVNFDHNSFVYRNFSINHEDETYNMFVEDLEGAGTKDTTGHYYSDMPTKFRAGIMFQPSSKILVELDWLKGNNNQPGNSTDNIISLGSEFFPVEFLALRAGTTFGGPAKFLFGLGAGLRFPFFAIDIAANGVNQMLNKSRFSFALSSKVMF